MAAKVDNTLCGFRVICSLKNKVNSSYFVSTYFSLLRYIALYSAFILPTVVG